MSHINRLVDDFLIQLSLSSQLVRNPNRPNQPSSPFIGVYLAKNNLQPFIDEFCARASLIYITPDTELKTIERILDKHNGVKFMIVQKPEPYRNSNHLTLTVGNLTSIIFDYEN